MLSSLVNIIPEAGPAQISMAKEAIEYLPIAIEDTKKVCRYRLLVHMVAPAEVMQKPSDPEPVPQSDLIGSFKPMHASGAGGGKRRGGRGSNGGDEGEEEGVDSLWMLHQASGGASGSVWRQGPLFDALELEDAPASLTDLGEKGGSGNPFS